MKKSRAFILATMALAVGFLAARWCGAQPSNQPPVKEQESYDFGAMKQLTSFVTYLQETKQTNILQRYGDLSNASLASRYNADLGVTLYILRNLREGRTNQACDLLESQLDSDIIGFVASYRQLPPSAREQSGLKALGWAKGYRAKYPFKHSYPNVDEGVANAFKILDEKP